MKQRLCIDCGKYFMLTNAQVKMYRAKEMKLPTHCSFCRNQRWDVTRQLIRRKNRFSQTEEKYELL